MHRRRFSYFLLSSTLALFMLGCGSVEDKSSSKTPPPPGMKASPTPSPNGNPGPGPTPTPTPGSPMPTPTPMNEVRLRARGEAVINGVEAELRGKFEREPERTRLEGELENINLPVGSAMSFCLMRGNSTMPVAVGIIELQDDHERQAEFELRTDEGQTPPNVQAGDVLQARDGANGNLADCSRPLLVAGTFMPDD